jgi:hypothetical protein
MFNHFMKKTFLDYHHDRLLALFQKLQSRLNKSIAKGKFRELSRNQQNKLLRRLNKLRIQLSRLAPRVKYSSLAVAATAGINLFSDEVKAQVLPAGNEFRVNTFTTGVQMYAKTAMDKDGDFVVTWASRGQDDGTEYGVYAQCYNSKGIVTTPEFRVNTYTAGRQSQPAIAMDDDGDFVIAWTSSGQDGNSGGVFAQRFNAAGQAQGSELQVNTATSGNQYVPAVAMDSDGDFVITWSGPDVHQYGVFARRFDAAGAAKSGEFQVNTSTYGVQRFSTVAMDDDGDFLVSWQSDDGSSYGIYGQRYNSSGVAQGGEFLVNTFTTNTQKSAAVAMDGDGDFVIAWQGSGQDGSSDGIFAQRYNNAGVRQGVEFMVNTTTTGSQTFPSVSMNNSEGDFVISWNSSGLNSDADGAIGARKYNGEGVAQGNEFCVNTFNAGLQSSSSVATGKNRDFIISWTSDGQDGSGNGVFAQRYEFNLAPVDVTINEDSLDENVNVPFNIGNFITTDPDIDDTFIYTLVAGTGDTDNSSFAISGNQLQINVSPDFEKKSSYNIRIRTTDQSGLSFEKAFVINVKNLDEVPANISLNVSALNENVGMNAQVGTFSAADPDAGETFTFALVSGTGDTDNASFGIDGNKLLARFIPDFETKSSYSIRVKVTDKGGLSFEKVFTITIKNLNEAPADISLSTATTDENVAADKEIGNFTTTDQDAAETFTYALVSGTGDTDNALFVISENKIHINTSPDFEKKNSYSIRVKSTDKGGLSFEKLFVITVNNVNEAPSGIALSATTVNENVTADTETGTFTTTDEDVSDTFTYSLVSGAGDSDNSLFSISGDKLHINTSPDFEKKNSYSIRVKVADKSGLSFEKVFVITVINVNEAPSGIVLNGNTVDENVSDDSIIGTLYANDVDAAELITYSLVSGDGDTDNSAFTIVSGNIQINESPDFETKNSYSVRVKATDKGGLSSEKAFTIAITDVNEAPAAVSLNKLSVDERVPADTEIGTFTTEDEDGSDTFTYSLVSGAGDVDNAAFEISGDKLLIKVKPDFETKNSYSIRIRSTDKDGLSLENAFVISVNDIVETSVNEANDFSASVQLYPNPASQTVHLNLDGPVNIRISDLSGIVVRDEMVNNGSIQLEGIPSGIYMMEIRKGNNTGIKKLIIE